MSRAYRCLVADDHPALVAAVSDFLESQGFEVVGRSRDGVAAVADVKETKPDIALVDYRMPHLSGVDLLEQIREAAPNTLIAVYTADTDQSIVGAVFDAGAHALILKDAPLADLAQALRTICAGQRYVDPALAQVMLNGAASKPALTPREAEVLAHIADGLSHQEIGDRLSISPETVRTHVRKACERLNARTRTHAVATALRLGLFQSAFTGSDPVKGPAGSRASFFTGSPVSLRGRPCDHRRGAVKVRHLASLEDKTAVVTGASSGIGAATAHALAEAGARVAVGARRVELLPDRDGLYAFDLDVRDEESSARFVERAVADLGGIDILVNNAGLSLGREPFWESTEEDEATVVETNVLGVLRLTRLCLPHIRDGGHIVNIGSIAGRQAYENAAAYVASKFAVRGFTYGLREDLLGRPIHLTTVDPGLVESEFSKVRFRGDEEQAKRVYEGVEPVTPADVAECILFVVTRPAHVNVDELVVKALAQSSPARIVRDQ